MNKRQAKKKKRNEILFYGMTYRDDRQLMREVREYETMQRRNNEISEDIKCLVELGIYTWEEAEEKLHAINKEKRRWRQIKKVE